MLLRVVQWFIRVVLVSVALAALVLLAGYFAMRPAQSIPVTYDVDATDPFTIVALGDSYMSGEGAAVFYEGTDIPGRNSCRRAPSAYPVRVAAMLETSTKAPVDLVFAACSGAETIHIGDQFTLPGVRGQRQYPESGEPIQIEALRNHPDADVVLISAGGNDARFSEVVKLCAGRRRSCIPLAQEWLENLDAHLQPQLRALYRQIFDLVGRNALVYVLTYPELFDARECPDIGTEASEVAFLIQTFIPRLNEHIAFAATMEGVRIIPLADVVRGEGLCARGHDTHGGAVNGFRWQRTGRVLNQPSEWLRGSMHPTEFGHALVAGRVVERIRADLLERTNVPRFIDEAPPGWSAPPGPPPFGMSEVGPPLGPWHLQPNPCSSIAEHREMRAAASGPVQLGGASPRSRVCFQTFKGQWKELRADSGGSATIPFADEGVAGLGGWRHVVHRSRDGRWVWLTLMPEPGSAPAEFTIFEAWLGVRGGAIKSALLLILVIALALDFGIRWWMHRRNERRRVAPLSP